MGVATIRARDVLIRANTLLIDEGAARWPYPELLLWLNDAQRALAMVKPTACAKPMILSLAPGARQEIPTYATQLLSVVRNVQDAHSNPPLGLATITTVSKADMDGCSPGWSDMAVWPPRKPVWHVMHEDSAPRVFWVWPPNNGTGRVEALLCVIPDDVPQPNARNDPASYITELAVDPVYLNTLVEWVMFRAYSKDDQVPDSAARAAAHLKLFYDGLGVRQSQENLRPARPGREDDA